MLDNLIKERARRAEALLGMERDLLTMKEELDSMQNKEKQAKMIEEALESYYSELYRENPIDRSHEDEIAMLIQDKNSAIKQAAKQLASGTDSKGIIDPIFSTGLNKYLSDKEIQARIRSEIKNEEKAYIIKMKRIFGELEVDIKRFYKKGISKIDLNAIIEMMVRICEEGASVGKFPLSYRQKIYKWQQFVKELPDDEERTNREEEKTEKDKLQTSLNKKKKELRSFREKIELTEQNCALCRLKLKTLVRLFSNAEEQYNIKRHSIELVSDKETAAAKDAFNEILLTLKNDYDQKEKKNEASIERIKKKIAKQQEELSRLNVERQEIEETYKSVREEYQNKYDAARVKYEEIQAELVRLKDEKDGMIREAKKTFVLSFGKKREMNEKIKGLNAIILREEKTLQERQVFLQKVSAEDPNQIENHPLKQEALTLSSAINELEINITKQQSKLDTLNNNDFNQELEKEINKYKEELDQNIAKIENKKMNQLRAIEEEKEKVQEDMRVAKVDAERTQELLDSLHERLKKKEEAISKTDRIIQDWHTNYLIKKFGKQFNIKGKIDMQKTAIKELSGNIKALKKELSSLDKNIAAAEKEHMQRQEELRRLQIEKAKEDLRVKKEQEQRQQRIQNELIARESEQELIKHNAAILDHIGETVYSLATVPDHILLSSDCPLQDDNKRIITNSIVRKQYMQSNRTPDCNQYALVFADSKGNMISEMRLIEQKTIGEKSKTSFELRAESGFGREDYYLLFFNFDTGGCICAQKYRINIAFSNDFGF